MPLRVFNVFEAGQLEKIIAGQDVGTLVQREKQS
jgi:uridylate kinase